MNEPSFTVGIEEEYLLVDRQTGALATDPPADMLAECERRLAAQGQAGQVTPEFLRAQIEVQTRVCRTVAEARDDLARLRRTVADVAGQYGLAPIAASTHPFADWGQLQPTPLLRYQQIDRDLQGVGRRLVICGLHVHVGIEDDELRIDLMNQAEYFLPHLLALSTSSPFWRGEDTGLKSYRLAVFNELPRTGPPDYFESYGEYRRQLGRMIDAGLIEDATKLWWDIRPAARFPTLEMRITDVPTRLEDTIGIAAMFQCILGLLWRLRRNNQRWRTYPHMLVKENRWRAQRYGYDQGLVDFGKGEVVPFQRLLDELIELTAPEAARFACVDEVAALKQILSRGSSAHCQLAVYAQAVAAGASKTQALKAVVDWLAQETVAGL